MKPTTIIKKVIKAFDDVFKEIGMPDMETTDILIDYYDDEMDDALLELYLDDDYPDNITEQAQFISEYICI